MQGLDDMYLFRQVVDLGGISAASRALRIPKSTVARRVADLEKRLGSLLFHRRSKGMTLTNFGHELHVRCAQLVEDADHIFDFADMRRERPTGFLHIIYPPSTGHYLIEPMAAEFVRQEPQVQLHLEASTGLLDPRSVAADLVFNFAFDPLPDVDIIARRLFSNPFILAAHPEVLKDRRLPEEPQALRGLPCIGFGPKTSPWSWRLTKEDRSYTHRYDPTLSTLQLSALHTAVRRGAGIGAVSRRLVEDEIARGDLVHVLPDWAPPPAVLYAIYPSGRTLTAAARRFMEMILEYFNQRTKIEHYDNIAPPTPARKKL
jgi:DNA-binding transcriptional LysR family regulator|tara:strand:+ start:514 stop:1464 length:951 start_codon:yes stop_codon:yes gene_type:complete